MPITVLTIIKPCWKPEWLYNKWIFQSTLADQLNEYYLSIIIIKSLWKEKIFNYEMIGGKHKKYVYGAVSIF